MPSLHCFRPADIQVLDEKVKHIRYIPPDPELFYKPSESLIEKNPKIMIANKEQQNHMKGNIKLKLYSCLIHILANEIVKHQIFSKILLIAN